METSHFQVSGINCEACTKLISLKLKKLAGVESVEVELNGHISIKGNETINKEQVKAALAGTDYQLA